MSWSFNVGRIAGTVVRIHVTFLLFVLWIWGASYLKDGAPAAWDGLFFILALFACVLAHEFGHILTARYFGIATPDVTLLPIGGVARLERIPEKPRQELLIAIAGPTVNIVIALVLLTLFGGKAGLEQLAAVEDYKFGFVGRLAAVNLFIAIFNLIPAFPMDGGRVLRALLSFRLGYLPATRIAAVIGQGFAFVLGFVGLFYNPMLIFIALFVYFAAGAESQTVALRAISQGVPVTAAMMTRYASLAPGMHVDEAVELLLKTNQTDFPVTEDGRLSGLLNRTDIIRALKELGPNASVGDAMTKAVKIIDRRRFADEAMRMLEDGSAQAVGVVDDEGRIIGLITLETLGEMMLISAAAPDFRLGMRKSA
ncbi:MAG: site-2 protease family protein [Xanthobacteraceae bacterium]